MAARVPALSFSSHGRLIWGGTVTLTFCQYFVGLGLRDALDGDEALLWGECDALDGVEAGLGQLLAIG